MGIVSGGGGGAAFNGGTITGTLAIAPTDPDTLPLKVTAPAFESAGLAELWASAAVRALQVDERGRISASAWTSNLATARGSLSLQAGTASIGVSDASGLGVASLDWITGAVIFSDSTTGRWFTAAPSGCIIAGTHAAPADGDLNAGGCALWFDQTNGAAKLMVKAKQANGTVVAASIALA